MASCYAIFLRNFIKMKTFGSFQIKPYRSQSTSFTNTVLLINRNLNLQTRSILKHLLDGPLKVHFNFENACVATAHDSF